MQYYFADMKKIYIFATATKLIIELSLVWEEGFQSHIIIKYYRAAVFSILKGTRIL
ncbi:hypothetical protein HMPREF3202_01891 [Prevotella bivia]|uniref:Uncharacterized protein n=1 Tax=Prevotella bivia TaxID=28125 RepID=A0A137SS92_9BACT|nr:hypothetical protein HMPREF3202_01891 [Prevotella bivia]